MCNFHGFALVKLNLPAGKDKKWRAKKARKWAKEKRKEDESRRGRGTKVSLLLSVKKAAVREGEKEKRRKEFSGIEVAK